MSFIYPQFLWALSLLAIPVLIHLFNFRRYKTLYFSNNRFIQAIQRQSKKFNRLRHWLILLLRSAALAMLVIAFARPFLPVAESSSAEKYLTVYIDNSLSMKVMGTEGPLTDAARNEALEILENLPENYRVQILTNDFGAQQQRFYSPREAIQMVDEIQVQPVSRNLAEIENQISGALAQSRSAVDHRVFLISDFQKSQFPELQTAKLSGSELTTIPMRAANRHPNAAIDSVWFEQAVLQPQFAQKLNIRLRNYGDESIEAIALSLEINGELNASRQIDLQAGESRIESMEINPSARGDYQARVSIDVGEPYFDNEFYFAFKIDEPVNIHLLGEDQYAVFERLFMDESSFNYSSSEFRNIDYSALQMAHAAVINEADDMSSGLITALSKILQRGGHIIVFTDPDRPGPVNQFLEYHNLRPLEEARSGEFQGGELATNDLIFRDVFSDIPRNPQMPLVKRYIHSDSRQGFPLLKLQNSDVLISRYPVLDGQLILFSTDLDPAHSNLSQHPLIVPILLNAALFSQGSNKLYSNPGSRKGPSYTLKGDPEIPLHIRYRDQEIIPRQQLAGGEVEILQLPAELEPGIYPVYHQDEQLGSLAVNIASGESKWEFWEAEDLRESGLAESQIIRAEGKQTAAFIKSNFQEKNLWLWFIAGALLLILIELLLLKLWS